MKNRFEDYLMYFDIHRLLYVLEACEDATRKRSLIQMVNIFNEQHKDQKLCIP